jgi:hypothetical protein
MIQGEKRHDLALRDTCLRPIPKYNMNYNPYTTLSEDLLNRYSPYIFKEPLYDDRLIIVNELPKNCIVASLPKRPRIAWV